MTEMPTNAELIKRLLPAAQSAACSAERELRRKPAGFRTKIRVGLGCAVFTIVSMSNSSGSPDRIAAQVVTGIGFLGAGAIMLGASGGVHGITTAATAWVNAALGTAAGAGLYTLAMMGGAVTLAVLAILGPIEAAIERRVGTKKD